MSLLKHTAAKLLVIIPIVLFAAGYEAAAQGNTKQEALAKLRQLASRYEKADRLGFNVKYKYALEQQPLAYIDSMDGEFRMNGGVYSYTLDSTEAIVNADYSIMLFKEDKIMYLTKPSGAAEAQSPLMLPDTLWLNDTGVECKLDTTGRDMKISIVFKNNPAFKKIEYYINKKTGMVARVLSYVQSSQLYDPSVRQVVDASVYAVMEMKFSNYREKSFDDGVLNMSKYFTKQGKEFATASAYESYKIFLGSPNL